MPARATNDDAPILDADDLAAFASISDDLAAGEPDVGHPLEHLALPTRTCPARHPHPDECWQTYRSLTLDLVASAETIPAGAKPTNSHVLRQEDADRIRATLEASPAPPVDTKAFVDRAKDAVMAGRAHYRTSWEERSPRLQTCTRALTALARHLVATSGATDAAVAAYMLYMSTDRSTYSQYERLAWADPVALALRDALSSAPEAGYDEALAWAIGMCEEETDAQLLAHMAFVLADDRDAEHPLQPLRVLQAVAAGDDDPSALLWALPLVAEAGPSAPARWRSVQQHFLNFGYCRIDVRQACGTVVATARRHGTPSAPAVAWLLHYAYGDDRATAARAVLDTDEPGAIDLLLPRLHEPEVRAALDAATSDMPARTFRQMASVLGRGRMEPALRMRCASFLATHPAALLRNWLSGDAKASAWLEAELSAALAPEAQEAHLPRALLETPWRHKSRRTADVSVRLEPYAVPFSADLPPVADNRRGLPVIGSMEETLPADDARLPPGDLGGDRLLEWIGGRVRGVMELPGWLASRSPWYHILKAVDLQPEPLALLLWELCLPPSDGPRAEDIRLRGMLARFGDLAMGGIVLRLRADIGYLARVAGISSPLVAPFAAQALLRSKKVRPAAMEWLRRNPEAAAAALLPTALGPSGAERHEAESALRWLRASGPEGAEAVAHASRRYGESVPGAAHAISAVLDTDPLSRFPSRLPKPPAWLMPEALSRPELRDGKGRLPSAAVAAMAEMLSFSTPVDVYAGVWQVREACTPESVASFAWDLFSAWLASGAPAKDAWAFRALGWLGDDETARKLTAMIRRWPGEGAHARAVTGLEILAEIGTDVALMGLGGIAEKLRFKGLQAKAREMVAALAEARGMTEAELADRLVPDLDLDDGGGAALDYGPRQFRVSFGPSLEPLVADMAGKRLRDLPKPAGGDDAGKAAEARKRWAALKKDARAAASLVTTRLEGMLSTGRRVDADAFATFFANHPLVRHMARRLVWGTYTDHKPGTPPSSVFRIGDDLSPRDLAGMPCAIPEGQVVGLVHPVHLGADARSAWLAAVTADGARQPFPQMDRGVHAFPEADRSARSSRLFWGKAVESVVLQSRVQDWTLASPEDGGVVLFLERPVALKDGRKATARLHLSEGVFLGARELTPKTQAFGEIALVDTEEDPPATFGDLDPVAASELLLWPSSLS